MNENMDKHKNLGGNDGEATSSSSNTWIEEKSVDRLSELPDCLLIHILSLLGVKRAAVTSLLSKRWQCLWLELPRLELKELSEERDKISAFVAGIHRIIARRTNYLERFDVYFNYAERFALDVNLWAVLLVILKVKEVVLWLISDEDFYILPQIMYTNPHLTKLSVRNCVIVPRITVYLRSLEELVIDDGQLSQHVIETILSDCCPVLKILSLRRCWGFRCLEVNRVNLQKLGLYDRDDGENDPLLEISAPYVRELRLWLYPEERELRLKNVSSLVKAIVYFNGKGWDTSSVEVVSNTMELLQSIKHVQEVELGSRCFEVLSMLGANGWKLPKSEQRCLKVYMPILDKYNISGILALLGSSPNLEKLNIEGSDPEVIYQTWDPPAICDLDSNLLHLKTVSIMNVIEFDGEPMLTIARILLKRATALEKMEVGFGVEDEDDFNKLWQTLLSYPITSQKAIIEFPE